MNHRNNQSCAHCGQLHGQGLAYCVNIAGEKLAMCCAGCLVVASLIANVNESPDHKKRDSDVVGPGG